MICLICKKGKMEPVGEIEIDLPTPNTEMVFGGKSPRYKAKVILPFLYCTECKSVIKE